MPASYWGQEHKACPVCEQQILAAALRCRHCGSTFDSARAISSAQYTEDARRKALAASLKRKVIWWFVGALLPCAAPLAALAGGIWYAKERPNVEALPSLYAGLARIALYTSIGQTVLLVTMSLLFACLRTH
jgi:predicted amidophosphoribosyltransferase